MLLLYHRSHIHCLPPFVIYIPLCFYFIDHGGVQCDRLHNIYIPLCFYFIAKMRNWEQEISMQFTFHYASTLSNTVGSGADEMYTFTFHYASTLSPLPKMLPHCVPLFTFHYASTLSILDYLVSATWINLHSTMLLLYLRIVS